MAFAQLGSLKVLAVAAGNGAGARVCTGAVVGDKVIGIFASDAAGANQQVCTASFEPVVTVADQLQQTATNLTNFVGLVLIAKRV